MTSNNWNTRITLKYETIYTLTSKFSCIWNRISTTFYTKVRVIYVNSSWTITDTGRIIIAWSRTSRTCSASTICITNISINTFTSAISPNLWSSTRIWSYTNIIHWVINKSIRTYTLLYIIGSCSGWTLPTNTIISSELKPTPTSSIIWIDNLAKTTSWTTSIWI